MLTAPFMTGRLTKEFIEKNGRSPIKDEFIAIQHEAATTLINNNSVYGICRQGGTKMPEIVFKGKPIPTEGQVIDHTPFGECKHPDPKVAFTSYLEHEHEDLIPPPPVVNIDLTRKLLKIMTKEMYENFVKQGKKFVTLTGQEFNSLEESGIDLDGDAIVVDGQEYGVNMQAWYLRGK